MTIDIKVYRKQMFFSDNAPCTSYMTAHSNGVQQDRTNYKKSGQDPIGSCRTPWTRILITSWGCQNLSESLDVYLISDCSDTFWHPTTSSSNCVPTSPTISDEFLSDPMKSDNFFKRTDEIRQWNRLS